MAEISNLSSILKETLLLSSLDTSSQTNKFQKLQEQLKEIPSVVDKNTLTKLKNGEYEISLKEYTSINTYNTMMNSLYGNSSANKFQNLLNNITNSSEDKLATAKDFIDKMKKGGMSNSTAVRTYSALQKYSLMSSFGNYNFLNAKVK